MINPRLQSRTGNALSVACALLLFVGMFDHMTAIKYVGIGALIIVIGVLAVKSLSGPSTKHSLPALPLLLALGAWALWTLSSAAWSFNPGSTIHSWLDEVAYPFAAFYAFWLVGKASLNQRRLQTVAWATCLSLAIASVLFFSYLDPSAPKPGLLHYYARVGHTSTLALMAIPLFASMTGDVKTRMRGLTGILFCIVIGAATLNRFFWIALAVVAVVLLWPRASKNHMRSWTALGALLLASLVAVGFSNKLRLIGANAEQEQVGLIQQDRQQNHPQNPQQISSPTVSAMRVSDRAPGNGLGIDVQSQAAGLAETSVARRGLLSRFREASGMQQAMTTDARPRIWEFYASQVSSHPWFGIGFGKPLPALAYGALIPEDLVKLDGNVRTHAHNLFLNTILQVGVIGLLLQLAVLACLAYQFYVARHAHPLLFRAGIALIVGMLAKNMTDDFMWQSTMLMFWSYCGWLLGQSAVRQNTSGSTTPSYREPLRHHAVESAKRELEPVSG
jgi:hypothetical protein